MLLRVAGFNGAALKSSPKILPDDIGVDARNLRPDRDDFRVWRAPFTVATIPAAAASIYRMGRDAPSDSAYWLSWTQDVDAAPGFVGTDTSERTYFTGTDLPRWTDSAIGLSSAPYPATSRPLGVPSPLNQPTLSIQAAGSGTSETRYYVAVWVTDKGEQGMPSPVSTQLACNSDATVRVTRVSAVPNDGRVYSYWRIYRTQANGAQTANFYFVAQVPVANAFYDDASGVLGEVLPSLTWALPDPSMRGITALWNGIMAGFVGKRLCFSEPYRPFAWPVGYELTTKDTIVGLGVWRQNLVVLTTGSNFIVTGSHPSSMSMLPMEFDHACASKRSIVGMDNCVVWASPIGLVCYGDSGGQVLTDATMSWDDWRALQPSTMRAARIHGRMYMASYTAGGDKSLIVDLDDTRGIYFQDAGFADLYWDQIQDALFVLSGTSVQKWDSGALQPGTFKSKVFRSGKPANFAWGQVISDVLPVTISLWCDGAQVFNSVAVNTALPFRLPAGYKGVEYQAQVTASGGVQALLLAESIEELKAVS